MAHLFERKKNKWVSQKIHKRYNNIHHASKGRVNYSRNKYPWRQRKRMKQLNRRRARSNTYDNMIFDFEDFTSKSNNHHYIDINLEYNDYYYPADYLKSAIPIATTSKSIASTFDGHPSADPWSSIKVKLKYCWTSNPSNDMDNNSDPNDIHNKFQSFGEIQFWRNNDKLHSTSIIPSIRISDNNQLQIDKVSYFDDGSQFFDAIKSKNKYIQWDLANGTG